MEWREHQSPDPFETERVGHPRVVVNIESDNNTNMLMAAAAGAAADAAVDAAASVTGDEAASWLNQGRYWRIGFGRKGGLRVFRSVIFGWKKDWWIGGPL
jgi:hypothetical protein